VEDNIAFNAILGEVSSVISTSETNERNTEEKSDSNSLVVKGRTSLSLLVNTSKHSSDFESEEPWEGQNCHFLGRSLPSLSWDCRQRLVA
jgi:hypothetical protein